MGNVGVGVGQFMPLQEKGDMKYYLHEYTFLSELLLPSAW